MADTAFVRIDDWTFAQALADTLSPDQLHRTLDRYAKLYCPVATFLGWQITPLLAQEIGSQFSTRIEGTSIKHRFGECSIKMCGKHGIVLRIETMTTANDVSFFKKHRKGGTPHRPRDPGTRTRNRSTA